MCSAYLDYLCYIQKKISAETQEKQQKELEAFHLDLTLTEVICIYLLLLVVNVFLIPSVCKRVLKRHKREKNDENYKEGHPSTRSVWIKSKSVESSKTSLQSNLCDSHMASSYGELTRNLLCSTIDKPVWYILCGPVPGPSLVRGPFQFLPYRVCSQNVNKDQVFMKYHFFRWCQSFIICSVVK